MQLVCPPLAITSTTSSARIWPNGLCCETSDRGSAISLYRGIWSLDSVVELHSSSLCWFCFATASSVSTWRSLSSHFKTDQSRTRPEGRHSFSACGGNVRGLGPPPIGMLQTRISAAASGITGVTVAKPTRRTRRQYLLPESDSEDGRCEKPVGGPDYSITMCDPARWSLQTDNEALCYRELRGTDAG